MADQPPKNIIYLIADSLRPDYLGCYGNSSVLTTEIDNLAADGVRFENVISAAPWTIPSVKSHATGKYPHSIDVFDSDTDEGPTVFDQFKNQGYKTALYYDSDRRTELFPENVDHYDWSYDIEGLLDFISDSKDEPFFIFNLYRGTHLPYTLKYSSNAWHLAKDDVMEMIRHGGQKGIEEAKHRYMNSVERFSEWYVGAIVDRLREEDLLEDTAIVITGDHGESWGHRFDDQQQVDLFDLHGTLLYDEVLTVPLILYNFDIEPDDAVSEMIRSVDILPTILDAIDMPSLRDDFDGRSLIAAIEKDDTFPELAFTSTTTHDQFGDIGEASTTAGSSYNKFAVSRSDGWKYIFSVDADTQQLYDRSTDPAEQTNLVDEYPEIVDKLETALQDEFGTLLSEEEYSEEVKSRLEDLGYL